MRNLHLTTVLRGLLSLALFLVLGLNAPLSAKKGGNKPPPDDGDSCASLPPDRFNHVNEFSNPFPTENGFFAASVAAQENGGTVLAAVVSKFPGKVHVYSIDSAGAATLSTSIELPGLETHSRSARVEIADVGGSSHLDLIVTHGGLEKGWIYLDDGTGTGTYPANPTVELVPDADVDARGFGWRGLVVHNGNLYISAWLASVQDRGPRGAVFLCDPSTGDCSRQGTLTRGRRRQL